MKNKRELKTEIIAVGSELLTPHFQDTNSLYLTQRLTDLGMEVKFKTIVGDDWDDLVLCIKEAITRADIIISTGGLGPTMDDRTREAFASVLNRKLQLNKELLKGIEARFYRRGLSMPSVNKKQAYIIDGSEIIKNNNGTAPGLWLNSDAKTIILLPGPPHEVKPMFESSIYPRLKKYQTGFTSRIVLKITGLTESKVETLISDSYPKASDTQFSTLAYPGQIEIHISAHSRKSQDQAEMKVRQYVEKILEQLEENVFSTTGESLEEVIGKLLVTDKKTLAVAESCTGGFLGHRLTNIPGSSNYFLQGTIVYSNESKISLLDVPADLIEKHGAVSPEIAQALATGARKISGANYGLSITGIAGPSGGTAEKPVGLVYIALAWEKGSKTTKNIFSGNREIVKFQSTQKALDMLRRHLLNNHKK